MGRFNCNVYIEEEQTIVSNRISMKANLDKRSFFSESTRTNNNCVIHSKISYLI
jgi:hypothetical protein